MAARGTALVATAGTRTDLAVELTDRGLAPRGVVPAAESVNMAEAARARLVAAQAGIAIVDILRPDVDTGAAPDSCRAPVPPGSLVDTFTRIHTYLHSDHELAGSMAAQTSSSSFGSSTKNASGGSGVTGVCTPLLAAAFTASIRSCSCLFSTVCSAP